MLLTFQRLIYFIVLPGRREEPVAEHPGVGGQSHLKLASEISEFAMKPAILTQPPIRIVPIDALIGKTG